MGKKVVIYVGFSHVRGFVSASSMAGLGRLIGVSVRTVMRNLEGEGKTGYVSKDDEVWWVSEVELVKQKMRGVAGKGPPVTSKIGK